jgi:hypothetical protein
MEMRKENLIIEEMGQEVELKQLEFEEFISGSENGLDVIDQLGNIETKSIEEIQQELNLDDIETVYYIIDDNSVKILLTNGYIHLMKRV